MGLSRLIRVGLVAVLPLSSATHAALIVLDQPVASASPAAAIKTNVLLSQIRYDSLNENLYPRILFGSPAKDVYMPDLKGQGRNVGLDLAVSQIIPNDFDVVVSPDLLVQKRKVNWKSSKNWISTFHDLLAKEDLIALIDIGRKEANVYPAGDVRSNLPSQKKTVHQKTALSYSTNPPAKTSVRSTVTPAPVVMPTWVVEKGKTLREVLEIWSDKEGWSVAWDANIDYPIESSFTLNGDYLSAVQKTVTLYESADRPLYATAYSSQKLIVITDKKGQL